MGLFQIILIALIAVTVMGAATWKPKESVARSVASQWGSLVRKYQQFYPGIPVAWALAMICYESSGDPNVTGDAGLKYPSTGLMQVRWPALQDFNAAYGKNYSEADLKTPYVNIEAGMGYLALRLKKQGSLDKATMAYNGGDGNVGSTRTKQYLERVTAYRDLLVKLGGF